MLNEAFSGENGWGGIAHNDFKTILLLWIIPKYECSLLQVFRRVITDLDNSGAWLIFPAYMSYVFGLEILEGLEMATSRSRRTS